MEQSQFHILLIEDNPGDAVLIRETLAESRACRFHVETVSSLRDAGRALAQRPVDLILADLGLPDSQGLDSLRSIQELAPTTPVVILSGLHDDTLALQAVRQGAQDYVDKRTLGSELLGRTLRYAIERHRWENALRIVAHAVSAKIGEQFFHTLVEQLALALRVDHVFLCEWSSTDRRRAHTRAAWGPTGALPRSDWELPGDPAERVADGQIFLQPTGLAGTFPNSQLVQRLRADAYLGVPVLDPDGHVVGVLEIASRTPIGDVSVYESTLRIFAARAGAELARERAVTLIDEWRGRYEAAIHASRQALYDLNTRTNAVVWGGHVAETFGYLPEEITHLDQWRALVHPEDRPHLDAEVRLALARHEPFEIEYRVRHKDGRDLYVLDTGQLRRGSDGHLTRVVGVLADITERKRLDEHLRHSQKMDAIGQLAGGLAHDFRNLLMAINGHLSLAKAGLPKDHPVQESLDQITEAARQAGGITTSLLTFSHKSPTIKKPVQLSTILEQTARFFRRTLPTTIRLKVEAQGASRWILADHAQIQQAIMNLAINAADAMPRGGDLTLTAADLPPDPGVLANSHAGIVCLSIHDTGAGMTPEVLGRIFEPYFTTKPRGQGTGLGLSITHSIIKEHGAAIRVDSRAGQGTTFTILFPAIEPEGGVGGDTTGTPDSRIGVGRTAMVVGSHALVRSVVSSMLTGAGFTTLQCASALVAHERLREAAGAVSLVVLDFDVSTPEMLDLIGRVREVSDACDILLITSHTETIPTLPHRTAVLSKPFQVSELCAALRALRRPPTPTSPTAAAP